MPLITEQPVRAFAHCNQVRCPGNNQEEVDAFEVTWSFTVGELSDDNQSPFSSVVERSMVKYRFADEDEIACPVCSRPREVTGQARPSYDNMSGFDPLGLVGGPGFDPGVRNTEADEKIAALEAQIAQLTQAFAEGKLNVGQLEHATEQALKKADKESG